MTLASGIGLTGTILVLLLTTGCSDSSANVAESGCRLMPANVPVPCTPPPKHRPTECRHLLGEPDWAWAECMGVGPK